jgi:DNA-binding response OmpR family regulator
MKIYKILIVDDIPDNIKVLQTILHHKNYELHSAYSGKDAIMQCTVNSYDLILLDVMMPEMNGYEVCEYLKSKDKTKDIPIIFLTARVDEESIINGFEVGAQDYVTKPFNAEELIARVNTHLELKYKNERLKFMNMQLEEMVAARTLELQDANKDLEEANRQLSTLEEAKNDFLSLMSTELREPLNGIVGFAEMLEYSIKNKTNLKYVRFIIQACEKLTGISDMALLLSALRFDRYEMNVMGIVFSDLVQKTFEKLKPLAKERKVKLKLDIPKNYVVEGDERLLEISLEKIVENAITNAPPKTEVVVYGEVIDQKIKITIKDQGTQFSSEEVDYQFRFFELSKEKKEEAKRFAPGLIIVKLVMDLHQSDVKLMNLEDGGVAVSFLLSEYK